MWHQIRVGSVRLPTEATLGRHTRRNKQLEWPATSAGGNGGVCGPPPQCSPYRTRVYWFEETIEALIETKPEQPNPKLNNEDLANALIDDFLLNALERLQCRKETFEVCKEIDSGLFDKAVEEVETTEMCKDIINSLLFDAAVQQIEPLKEEKVFEDLFDDAFKLLFSKYNQEREKREYFRH